MDYPKSVAGVGLLNGKFVDENVTSGQVGSLIPAAWGNAVTDEILAVLAAAGIAPVEGNNAQLRAAIQALLAVKAPLASPALTGTPTTPTAPAGTNTTQIANTAFVQAAIAALVNSSPAALDTLKELAAALGNDPNFAVTMTNALAGKADKATTLAGYGIVDALKIGQVGLAAMSAPALPTFEGFTANGLYMAMGAGAQTATPGAPADSQNNVLGVLAVSPRPDATYYLAFENASVSASRRFWVGQYNSATGLYWSRLMTSEHMANQIEAEDGADNTKWMSPWRVAQAIAKKVIQATETVLGIAKIATQSMVNAGADDATIVTPKKLRWGVSYLIAANGYIAFPSWLGGWIVQWGTATISTVTAGGTATISLPYSYPNNHFGALGNYKKNAVISDSFPINTYPTSLSTVTLSLDPATGGGTPTGPQDVFYLSVGN